LYLIQKSVVSIACLVICLLTSEVGLAHSSRPVLEFSMQPREHVAQFPFMQPAKYEIVVNYQGSWSGSVGGGGSQRTEEGTSSRTIEVEGYPAVAVIQKKDGTPQCMRVTVRRAGDEKSSKSQKTCAAYGAVSVTGP
jgi:hypothetical protein